MAGTAPLLAVLAAGDQAEDAPLLRQLEVLSAVRDVEVVDVTQPRVAAWLGDLGVPLTTARSVLEPTDLAALVRPFVLRHLLAREGAVLVLDAWTHVHDVGGLAVFDDIAGDGLVVPALHLAAERRTGRLGNLLEAGYGQATSAAVAFCSSAVPLLDTWSQAVLRTYIRNATASIADVERRILSALPGGTAGSVGWAPATVAGSWRDLADGEPWPAVVTLDGLAAYLDVEASTDGRSEGRVPDPVALEALRHVVEPIRVRAPSTRLWEDGDPRPGVVSEAVRAIDPHGIRWPDPASVELRSWLDTPDVHGLTTFARTLYWSRPDLRRSYPADASAFVFADWLREQRVGPGLVADGQARSSGLRRTARAVARRLEQRSGAVPTIGDARLPEGRELHGVNIVGYFRAANGLGQAARATLASIRRLGVPVSVVDLTDRIPAAHLDVPDLPERGVPFDCTILHVNPVEVLGYADDDLAYRLGAAHVVGFWFWETDRVPASWREAFAAVDEVWASSTFLQRVLGAVEGGPPAIRVPLPAPEVSEVSPDRERFGLSADEFVITYVCDVHSGAARKNPLGAVSAFRQAFTPDEPARLVLKVGNLSAYPGFARGLRRAVEGSNVTLLETHLDDGGIDTLLASSDAYFSPHAAEGYGLTILEAMAHGLPVVATGFGGPSDFVTDGVTGHVIPFRLVDARGGPGDVYTGTGQWAEPDLAVASARLRDLYEDRAGAARLGAGARVVAAERSTSSYDEVVAGRLRAAGVTW